MKNFLKILYIIIIIIFLKLTFSFLINLFIINNYNNNIYNNNLVKTLYLFNFNEPYIAYYNEGNILYKKEKYEEAIEKYQKAIAKNPPQKRICDIRINLSLTIIKNIKSSNNEEIIEILEEAKENLYNNNCANKYDDNGYSKEAEKLEQEIINLQENLSKNNSSENSTSEENDSTNDDDVNENVEEQLKDLEKDANSNRQSDLTEYENMGDYSSYTGDKW